MTDEGEAVVGERRGHKVDTLTPDLATLPPNPKFP